MPNRVPLQSVVVQRDGVAVVPTIGAIFSFTDEEVADFERVNPDAISTMVSVSADAIAEAPVSADTIAEAPVSADTIAEAPVKSGAKKKPAEEL